MSLQARTKASLASTTRILASAYATYLHAISCSLCEWQLIAWDPAGQNALQPLAQRSDVYATDIHINSLQHPPAVAVQTLLADQLRPADALVPLLELF
jgi:hypothetical protein